MVYSMCCNSGEKDHLYLQLLCYFVHKTVAFCGHHSLYTVDRDMRIGVFHTLYHGISISDILLNTVTLEINAVLIDPRHWK